MIILNAEALRDAAYGASFLGSGGGGAFSTNQELVESIIAFTQGQPVYVQDLADIPAANWGAVVAAIGSPDALVQHPEVTKAAAAALQRLSTALNRPMEFVLSVETGANMFIAMLTALQNNLPIVNADGVGRAVPELEMTTYAAANVPISPFTLVDVNEEFGLTLSADSPEAMETLVRPIISDPNFGELGGLACWAMNGTTLQTQGTVVPNTFATCQEVGHVIRSNQGANAVQALLNYFGPYNAALLTIGKIIDVEEVTAGGFDRGTVVIQDSTGVRTTIVNQNENLIAWQSNQLSPIAWAPHSICYLTTDGKPYNNGDNLAQFIDTDTEFAVIVVRANVLLGTSYFTQVFGQALQNIGYYGEYNTGYYGGSFQSKS